MAAHLLEGGICLLAWKRRSNGVLGSLMYRGATAWEQRWIVVAGTRLLYYELGGEDGTPRGSIDLILERPCVQVSSKHTADAPSEHEIEILVTGIKAPTKGEHSATQTNTTVTLKHWRFCFCSQQDLIQFLSAVHKVQDAAGQYESKDIERFEHDFLAGDHLYRWEMIVCPPVIYPIQIHAIVLEAGRNCVVVADFGLTGYGRKEGSKFNHAGDHDASINAAILAAFKKFRPQQDQRLNILTLTEPMDIRRWTKANYDHSFFTPSSTGQFKALSDFLGMLSSRPSKDDNDEDDERILQERLEQFDVSESTNQSESSHDMEISSCVRSDSPKRSNKSKATPLPKLPKSDPTEIVLARTNWLLENEDLLPPYHVFYSNSECIAVWCKTGRWSTLQTAVFLGTTSVGGAKSATLATMGVAAAHVLLAPVVAVGGIIWVSAPMVILKESRKKWQETTMHMTQLFWEWAPPAVFVSAIENWSGLVDRKLDDTNQAESATLARHVNNNKDE